MLYVNFAMVHYPVDEAQRLMYIIFYCHFFVPGIDGLHLGLRFRSNDCRPSNHSRIGNCMTVSDAPCPISKMCRFLRVS